MLVTIDFTLLSCLKGKPTPEMSLYTIKWGEARSLPA